MGRVIGSCVALSTPGAGFPVGAAGEKFSGHPVKVIVPFGPGSFPDIVDSGAGGLYALTNDPHEMDDRFADVDCAPAVSPPRVGMA